MKSQEGRFTLKAFSLQNLLNTITFFFLSKSIKSWNFLNDLNGILYARFYDNKWYHG